MSSNRTEVGLKYVIITPARNERKNIGRLLNCMIAQSVPPDRWIIVDDHSTDGTREFIQPQLPPFSWIDLVTRPEVRERSFAAKVDCFNAGYERIRGRDFDIVGNVDADVSFGSDYFEFLLKKFEEDPRLGVAGTPFEEDSGYSSVYHSYEGERHVAGGCQLFRRRCFEDVGGYFANPRGGIDWIAVTTARMKGWETRSFRDRTFHHHRSLGIGEGSPFAAQFSYGRKDYYLGNHPLWELFRVLYQMSRKPYILGGLTLMGGYFWEATAPGDRPISRELMAFHRKEEMRKLKAILRSLLRGKRADV